MLFKYVILFIFYQYSNLYSVLPNKIIDLLSNLFTNVVAFKHEIEIFYFGNIGFNNCILLLIVYCGTKQNNSDRIE